ncbi:MAG: zinc-binding dehydrogenase [Thermoplasmata archaeon]
MAKGEAAVFVKANEPFEFHEYPLPEVESGGILVRVKMASICGTDLHIYRGEREPPLPIILGHEAMGKVEILGDGVETDTGGQPLREGDRVTWSYIWTCGTCRFCNILKEPTSCLNRFTYGLGVACDRAPHFTGGFAEYIYLQPGTSVFRVPDTLSDEVIAPVNCALVTMVHVTDKAQIRLNENVVVQGSGPLGLFAMALAKEKGAGQVIALDTADSRLVVADAFGVDETINVAGQSDEEVVAAIQGLTDGIGADVVIEATGVPQALPQGLKLPRDGGRYLTIGPIYVGAAAEFDLFNLIFRRIQVLGVARNDARHLKDAIQFMERTRARYPYEKVVGAKFALSDVEEAFKKVESRTAMRTALVPGSD